MRLHSKKKTYAYQERCEEARSEFLQKIAYYRPEQLIYMDESGINNNEPAVYGWCEKGKRYDDTRPGKRRERLSIIGALCENKFLAPIVYQGYCNAKLVETWLEKVLLPQVEIGQVIVMDNAPFHNSRRIRELVEKAGCELLFLPSYSPDLNPIEHWWHKVKTAIRKELRSYNFDVHKAADAAFQYL
ncbi:IS630 family transposase [Argonema galeatum]|uniref:IS630 family transposase n=1 Tax=Argonema galeatum TaxID=2942762 RepID=UPI0020122458|nr:IS630 family transposase [Argonema galeatum A003/A1]